MESGLKELKVKITGIGNYPIRDYESGLKELKETV